MNFDKLINGILKEDKELSRQDRIQRLRKDDDLLVPKEMFSWYIKSVGYQGEDHSILDDREWTGEWDEHWEDGEEVSFERGLEELKDYVFGRAGMESWDEIQAMLREIKAEVGTEGIWKLWSGEYDLSLGVEVP